MKGGLISSITPDQHRLNYDFRDAVFLRGNLEDYITKFINSQQNIQDATDAKNMLLTSMLGSGSRLLKYIAWCATDQAILQQNNHPFTQAVFDNDYMPFLQCLAVSLKYDTAHDFTVPRGKNNCKHQNQIVLGNSVLKNPSLHGWLSPNYITDHFKNRLEDKFPNNNNVIAFITSLNDVKILSSNGNKAVFKNAAADLKSCKFRIRDTGLKTDICTLKAICSNIIQNRTVFSMIDSAGCGYGNDDINYFINLTGQIFLYNIGLIFFQSFYTIMKAHQLSLQIPAFYIYIDTPPNAYNDFEDFQSGQKRYNLYLNITNMHPTAVISTKGGSKGLFTVNNVCNSLYLNIQNSILNPIYSNQSNKQQIHNAIFCIMKGYGDFGQLFYVNLMSSISVIPRYFIDNIMIAQNILNLHNQQYDYNPLYKDCILETIDTYLMKIAFVCQTNFITATPNQRYYYFDKGIPLIIGNAIKFFKLLKISNSKNIIQTVVGAGAAHVNAILQRGGGYKYMNNKYKKGGFGKSAPEAGAEAEAEAEAEAGAEAEAEAETGAEAGTGAETEAGTGAETGVEVGAEAGAEERPIERDFLDDLQDEEYVEFKTYDYNQNEMKKREKIKKILKLSISIESSDIKTEEHLKEPYLTEPLIIHYDKFKNYIETLNLLYDTIKVHTFQLYEIELEIEDNIVVFKLKKKIAGSNNYEVIYTYITDYKLEDFLQSADCEEKYKKIYSMLSDKASYSVVTEFINLLSEKRILDLFFELNIPQQIYTVNHDYLLVIEFLNKDILTCKDLESKLEFLGDFFKDILKIAKIEKEFFKNDELIPPFLTHIDRYIELVNAYRQNIKDNIIENKILREFLDQMYKGRTGKQRITTWRGGSKELYIPIKKNIKGEYAIIESFKKIDNLLGIRIKEINELGKLIIEQRRGGGKKHKNNSKITSSQKIYNNLQKTSRFLLRGGSPIDDYEKIMDEYYDNISYINDTLTFDLIAVFYKETHILYNFETIFDFINAIKKEEESNGRIGRSQTVSSSRRLTISSRSRSRSRDRREKKNLRVVEIGKYLLIDPSRTLRGGGNYSKTDELKIDKSIKKYINILGRKRCIYTKIGSKKEYIKTKNQFVLIKDFIKLHSKNSIKPSKTIKDTKLQTLPKPKVNKASQEAQKDIKISPKPKSKPKVNKASLEAQKDINISPKPKSKPKVNKVK
jgi:hypothetical protein